MQPTKTSVSVRHPAPKNDVLLKKTMKEKDKALVDSDLIDCEKCDKVEYLPQLKKED